jgi:threonine dehydrogenase-like Zn-dependent dehydrogenase
LSRNVLRLYRILVQGWFCGSGFWVLGSRFCGSGFSVLGSYIRDFIMQVVAITGPRTSTLVERPDPQIAAPFALIKIMSAPICTEVQGYRDGQISDCLGHEAAGEVVAVAQPGLVAPGDRVVVMPQYGCGHCALCRSGDHIHCQSPLDPYAVCGTTTGRATYAQYCIKPDWLLVKIPDDISYDHASMACCGLGPTFTACERMQVGALDTVLVSGLGAVGLGAVVNATTRGARVIALEPQPFRAELGRALGATHIFDPRDPEVLAQIRAVTGGRGADYAIEASNHASAPPLLVEAVRPRGQITCVAWSGNLPVGRVLARGLTIHGAWHWNHLTSADHMFQTIRQASAKLDLLITHRLPMAQVQAAWELQLAGACGKIILHPWAGEHIT